MKTLSMLFVILSLTLTATAQPPDTLWTKLFGGRGRDEAYSVDLTNDHGFILTGICTTDSDQMRDVIIIKTDSLGNRVWTHIYGESGQNDYGQSCLQTDDGGYVVAGWSIFGAFLIKLDSQGNRQWLRYYGEGGDYMPFCVKQTFDRGFICAGRYSFAFSNVPFCFKTDSSGILEWFNTVQVPNFVRFSYVIQARDSNFVFVGWDHFGGIIEDQTLLVKMDQSGQIIWYQTYGRAETDFSRCVKKTADGKIIISGETTYHGSWNENALLMKLTTTGDVIWLQTWGDIASDHPQNLCLTADGGYAVCNNIWFGRTEVVKTDSIGNIQWRKRLSRPGDHYNLMDIQQTWDGGYIAVGYSDAPPAQNYDIWLVRLGAEYVRDATLTNVHNSLTSSISNSVVSINPNPFNPTSIISYELQTSSRVSLNIFDISGRLVAILIDGWREAGSHEVTFDGSGLAAGIYLVNMKAGEFTATQKIVLLR
jgi:hypothetical protein